MAQIDSPQSVYRELVEDSTDDWLLGLVAFAVFEEQRIEWMRHIEKTKGSPPSASEIANWYTQQPPGALLRAKGEAESALVAYAGATVEEALQTEQKSIMESTVISEIRLTRRILPQLGINIVGGFVSAIVFAAFLVIIYFVVASDVSPLSLAKEKLGQQIQENNNGQEVSK